MTTMRKTSRRPRPTDPKTPAPSATPRFPTTEPGRVTLAVVAGAHGIGGEVKLKLFTDDLSRWRVFNHGALTLTSLRGNVARVAEISDRTAAEALRGTALTVARDALPPLGEGEYYHADLIGLPVHLPDGGAIGQVAAVENFGAGDLIEIERPDGKRFMAPLRPEAVPEWDHERLILDPAFADG